MQAPVPRAVDLSEPAIMMVRAVGIEPTLLAERDFELLLSQIKYSLIY